ncbi:MAG: hypothetical protein ACI9LV_000057 [Candidatus Nanohaloarchaea archaeon]|jgi:hypothetical protein
MSISIRMVVSMVLGIALVMALIFMVQNQTGGAETFLQGLLP